MITIVDYKTANLGSIVNMLKHLGHASRIAETPEQLQGASHVLLPGIGRFDVCARNLRNAGFVDMLSQLAFERDVPILGICVGAQLLTRGSEEGDEPGLGWIEADTVRFPELDDKNYKIPHMGWNIVSPRLDDDLFTGFDVPPRFYFVHSYCMQCDMQQSVAGQTHHGIDFASAIRRDNIVGVQFHPEKSHRFGMQLLNNFVAMSRSRKAVSEVMG